MEGYSDYWQETSLPDGSMGKRNVKKAILLSWAEGAGSPNAKGRTAESSRLSGRTTCRLGQQPCTQCTLLKGRVSVEFGAHISATFISANTTRRRQSQRLFNSAPSNTSLTHFGDLHFSEQNPSWLTSSSRLAFRRIFPDAQQHGCFFHMSQCIWRRIQQTPALQERYTSDSDFAVSVRTLAALAFFPLSDIVRSFEELIDSPFFQQNEEVLRDIVNYFEDTWIGRPNRRGGRAEPLFPHALWNCVEAVHADLPKTNNAVEGWHRGFSELLGSNHPSIWKFISAFKKSRAWMKWQWSSTSPVQLLFSVVVYTETQLNASKP